MRAPIRCLLPFALFAFAACGDSASPSSTASLGPASTSPGESGSDASIVSDSGAVKADARSPAPEGGSEGGAGGAGLSSKYPNDQNIGSDPAVIFHSDFENDLSGWSAYTQDVSRISVPHDAATAHAGSK